jgi:hypothetical protein
MVNGFIGHWTLDIGHSEGKEVKTVRAKMIFASFLVLVFVVGAAFAGAAEKPGAKPAAKAKFKPPKDVYECTHCKVGMDKPGKCPMCGMKLEKMKSHICEKCMKEADKAGT